MTPQPFSLERRGLLLVLSAPSGGGKSVVLQRLLESERNLRYSVSVTTRPPRENEIDGRHYQFVSRDEFGRLAREDRFYEWAEVHGNLYGTREDTVQAALDAGQDICLDLDVKGGISVKWRSRDAVLVFLMPPSMKVLEERLRSRESDTEEAIQVRLRNAREEIQHWRLYDYVVTNVELDDTIEQVRHILQAERLRAGRLRIDLEV